MKKLYLFILCMLLAISALSLSVSADSYYDEDGYLTLVANSYNSERDYTSITGFNPAPVMPSNVSIPDGYRLVAFCVSTYSGCRYHWYYAPSDSDPFECYLGSSGVAFDSSDQGFNFFILRDNVSSTGTLTYYSKDSTNHITEGWGKVTLFVPVLDQSGDIVRPENQIHFTLNTVFDDQNLNLYFNASCNSSSDNPVSFYIFPSSVNITSGSQSTIISDTYVTEITPSQNDYLNQIFGGKLIIGEKYFDYLNQSTFGVIPKIVFYDTVNSIKYGNSFDPDAFGVPYLSLGSKVLNSSDSLYLTQTFMLNVPSMDRSSQGVYLYNDLCIVAVVPFENRYFTARFDFSRSALKSNGISAPNKLTPPVNYTGGTVSDLQELADYLQYLFQTNDNNRLKQDNNVITYLQSIDWSGYMANGVASGMANFLPKLSAEFDTMLNGLFDDFFVPDLDDIKDQVEADEEEFSDKFQWVHDIKAEIHFITTTPLSADDDEFVFHTNLNKWGVGDVTFFDSEWIDSSTRTALKTIISVFCTIALVFYIFKTLPSTLGNMPTD